MSCTFCRIAAHELPADIVFEDDRVIVFPDIHPLAATHLLVVPKEHIPSLATTLDSHQDLLGLLLQIVARVAKTRSLAGYRAVINTGREGGQTIDHLHVHLIAGPLAPTKPGDPRPAVIH